MGEWTCAVCTVRNDDAKTRCSVCMTDKPAQARRWTCSTCTLNNKGTDSKCSVCGTAKPGGSASQATNARAPTVPVGPKEADVKFLEGMGFSRSACLAALRKKTSRDAALDHLLESARLSQQAAPAATTSRQAPPASRKQAIGKQKGQRKKKTQEDKRKRELQKQKEKERLADLAALQKIEDAKQEDLKKKARLARQSQAKQAERLARQKENAHRKAQIEQDLKREADAKAILDARWARRDVEEQSLADIPAALDQLKEEYGPARFASSINMIQKILRNLLKHPSEQKYRSVNLNNQKIQRAIVRPLGAWMVLRLLGFQRNSTNSQLTCASPNTALLQSGLKRLAEATADAETVIRGLFAHIQGQDPVQTENGYFALLELHKILHNVITLPNERNFCSIDLFSEQYLNRLCAVPAALHVVRHFGFIEHKNAEGKATYLIVDNPDLPAFESGLLDVQKEIARLKPLTPIFQGVGHVYGHNPKPDAARFVTELLKAVGMIRQNPQDQKYRKFNTRKFFNKTGPIDGGTALVELVGFQIFPEEERARYPAEGLVFEELLLQLRHDDLTRSQRFHNPPE